MEPDHDVLRKFSTLDVTVIAEAINAIYKAYVEGLETTFLEWQINLILKAYNIR